MIVADPEYLELAAAAAPEVRVVTEATLRELRGARAVMVRQVGAWQRIRAWRAGGVAVGVVVVVDREDSPDDRPRLEPVVLLRRTTREGLLEALERLAVGEAPSRVALASGVADFHRQVFERADHTVVQLTSLEARLLAYLAARSFRVVGRDELQEQVWGYRKPLPTKAVEMTVGRLRRKIEQTSLLTVRGEGYRAVRLAAGPEAQRPDLAAFRSAVQLLLQHGRHGEATALLDRHEQERRPDDVRALAEVHLLRARVAQEVRELATAATAARAALALADAHGWPTLLASASVFLAGVLRFQARPDEARDHASRAVALFTTQGDDLGLARALSILSEVSPPAEGLALAERALALVEHPDVLAQQGLDALALRANLRSRLGTAHRRAGRLPEALAHWEVAAAAYALLGRAALVAQVRSAVGQLQEELGDGEAARRTFARALAEAPGPVVPLVHSAAALAAVQGGRATRAHAEALEAHVAATPDEPSADWMKLVVACCRLADADLPGARGLLAQVHPTARATQHHQPLMHAWLTALLDVPPRPDDVPRDEALARALVALRSRVR